MPPVTDVPPTLGPLAAYPPTPRTHDGAVDLDTLGALVDRAVAAGVDAVAVLGSTGGAAYLERADRRRVVAAAAEAVAGRVPLVAGAGALTTEAVLAHATDAAAAGADAVLVQPTSYLPLTGAEAVELYRAVGAASPVPVWAYHNPITTRLHLDVPTLARIAALPGVAGLKDRGTDPADLRDRVTRLRDLVPATTQLGCSGDLNGVHGVLAGATTWHSGVASVLPGSYVAVAHAAAAGDEAAALAGLERLRPVVDAVLAGGGVRAVHALAERLGLPVGRLPAPLLPPDDDALAALDRALAASDLPELSAR